ncbi:MAG: aminomethyl-transferring glycine dehydrogenase [Gammaproteobacteria bacterium]|jgi:glycine dehydrogenase|nr:aminomethyl-transferring glycine dehydrogenase [Gammaproteobacteria bacterium]
MNSGANIAEHSTLQQLENHGGFIRRHIGPREQDILSMLADLGCDSLDQLIDEVMPKSIRRDDQMQLPRALNETEMLAQLRQLGAENTVCHNMIGLGYHDTITPPVIKRSLLENPGWYTAYTPYQAEISQGRLQALLNFQQMIMDLTAMPLANASLLDEATAAAEAMVMLQRINSRNSSRRFLVADNVLPQTLAVLETRAQHFAIEVVCVDQAALLDEAELNDCFGIMLNYPGGDGQVINLQPWIEAAHAHNVLVSVACDLLSLAVLKPPGEMDADVVIGSAQRFGVQPGFGGPHAAFFATREAYARRIPGRIIGVSKDRLGKPALRMALQTREQHIRREKAMSNICTAQALLAIIAGFYAIYHGANGLRTIAGRIHRLTRLLAAGLSQSGYTLRHQHYFDTLFIELDDCRREQLIAAAASAGINLRRDDISGIGISINEATTREHIQSLWQIFGVDADLGKLDQQLVGSLAFADGCQRSSDFLQHEVFHRYRSETELLRYLKRLENRDISLTHSMISLGSCTMKLNAAAEMEAITWPEFAGIHPFAPNDQTRGYRKLIHELEDMLKACTGYDAVSLQPNAGSQGEYAGLLAIRAWHASRGEDQRNICLIPSSAHGTNPASALMAGLRIVIIGCDEAGNIDVDELKAHAEQYTDQLAALMITYPSTHGVFEERVVEICDIVHQHGGQVYLDGANLNALVGWSAPGQFGADVSHLNLHKTFCIPHGGGGPGVGPVCVREHLAAFLPAHPLQPELHGLLGPVSATPWGSAGILPISWAYITLMGREGLRRATQVAILNANYLATHLSASFKVLYSGRNDRVAHECIIDLRPFKQTTGISEEDIAKRLVDYGFHAPTMSWPVPGTLMIEPTESESKAELDRFIAAMHGIRAEINQIQSGELDAQDNPLKNAPITVHEACADDWSHAYSRSQAAYPAGISSNTKYWPLVSRVDNVHGDRNLVCSCPPLSDYMATDEPVVTAVR